MSSDDEAFHRSDDDIVTVVDIRHGQLTEKWYPHADLEKEWAKRPTYISPSPNEGSSFAEATSQRIVESAQQH
jgi:hypothetical protein